MSLSKTVVLNDEITSKLLKGRSKQTKVTVPDLLEVFEYYKYGGLDKDGKKRIINFIKLLLTSTYGDCQTMNGYSPNNLYTTKTGRDLTKDVQMIESYFISNLTSSKLATFEKFVETVKYNIHSSQPPADKECASYFNLARKFFDYLVEHVKNRILMPPPPPRTPASVPTQPVATRTYSQHPQQSVPTRTYSQRETDALVEMLEFSKRARHLGGAKKPKPKLKASLHKKIAK